jgi:hypothetical protein
MPEEHEEWPGQVFINAYRADVMNGRNLEAPKLLLTTKTARRCDAQLIRGHKMAEIDLVVDQARLTVMKELGK